jgi:SprT-like protein
MDEQEFIGIIKHELCHYHLHIEEKGYRHRDPEFKNLLKKTGSPRHCKPLPSVIRNYKHVYKCRTCNFTYKRMRRINVEEYRCGRCHGRIAISN